MGRKKLSKRCIVGLTVLFIASLASFVLPTLLDSDSTSFPKLPLPGQKTKLTFQGQKSASFTVQLAVAEYLSMEVDQQGIDISISVWDPSGKLHSQIDSPTGKSGSEKVDIVSEVVGGYRIELIPFEASTSGDCTIRTLAKRPANDTDRVRARAALLFAQAEKSKNTRSEESQQAAVENYLEATKLYATLGDWRFQARAQKQLGATLVRVGRRDAALTEFQAVVALLSNRGDPDHLLAATLNRIGVLQRAQGDLDLAQHSFEAALDLFRQRGFLPGEAVAWNNLGRLSSARGEMHDAQYLYEKSLALWQKIGDRDREVRTLINLGAVYMSLGQIEFSLDQLDRAESLLTDDADPGILADLLDQMADAYAQNGERSKATAYFERALQLHRRTGDRRSEAYTLDGLGRLYYRIEDYEAARRSFETALELFTFLSDSRGQSLVLRHLGLLSLAQGKHEKAFVYYQSALPLATEVGNRTGKADALMGMARIAHQSGHFTAALSRIREALEVIETLRRDAGRPELSTAFLSTRRHYYELAIEIAMDLDQLEPQAGHHALAFALSERAKARGLLDSLPRLGTRSEIDPVLIEQEQLLNRQINEIEHKRTLQSSGTLETEKRLRALIANYQKVRGEIHRTTDPLPKSPQPLTLEDVQTRFLDRKTILLHYELGHKESYLWIISPAAIQSYRLPPRKHIETAARAAHDLLSRSHHRAGRVPMRKATAHLAKMILPPSIDLGDSQRLLIVSDGALQYIPFGALPHPDTGDPLITHFEVVYAPSSSVVALIRHRKAGRYLASGEVAVIADPVFSPKDTRVNAGGAEDVGLSPATIPSLRALENGRLARLRFTRREAEGILALAPKNSYHAFDFAATKDLLTHGTLDNYRILHIATHGLLDARYPELSGIAFSLVDRAGRPRDGFLRVHEIYGLNLQTDLVVLSACSTALGAQIHGEGLVGLTQAFLQVGASRVIVSLWDVDDRATAELIQRFYFGLWSRDLAPAAALREAQVSMRQETAWSAPFFWAGFVLQGEWH